MAKAKADPRIAQRRERIATVMQSLLPNGPIPADCIAERVGLRLSDVSDLLRDMESNPGPGPLMIDGGWIWVD